MLKKLWPIFLIIIIIGGFFWKVIAQGAVLVPTDLLVGAYYPWRENNWGYDVAVPYKNPLISDSYSQFFVWKKLVSNAYKIGEWPLWNQYSYSGYPLLGNLHSGALYPLNILMVILPFNSGWNAFLIGGMMLSAINMYIMLRILGRKKITAVAGGIAYGMCGYSISWLEFATASHSMAWLPLILAVALKFFKTGNKIYLWWLTPLLFLLVSVGHFQITMYGLTILVALFILNIIKRKQINGMPVAVGSMILGGLMSMAVLLPSFELMSMSIRNIEGVISDINYGLAPWGNFITLIAPDFFGNPATNNFWGFLNYHEVLIYSGIGVTVAWGWSLFNIKKLNFDDKFFLGLTLVSIVLFFDNPLSRTFFWLNLPGLGTGMAGRIAVLFALGGAVLLSLMLEKIEQENWRQVIKYYFPWIGFIIAVGAMSFIYKEYDVVNVKTALRNLVVPMAILGISMIATLLFRKKSLFVPLMIALLMVDMFRFGWKYLPFSDPRYVFPQTEVTDFLEKQTGVFRVDKEYGPVLSPNTWTMYGLMSPSGYDPMAVANYTKKFNQDINNDKENYSRYAEAKRYDAKTLGKYNVRYFLALKRYEDWRIGGEMINDQIQITNWERVAESKTVAVLENKDYLPRAFVKNNTDSGMVEITEYQANKVVINYDLKKKGEVVLLDTYYPGWVAKINGKVVSIDKYEEVFRSVAVEAGQGIIEFNYEPATFYWGIRISIVATLVWLGVMLYYLQRCLKKVTL